MDSTGTYAYREEERHTDTERDRDRERNTLFQGFNEKQDIKDYAK